MLLKLIIYIFLIVQRPVVSSTEICKSGVNEFDIHEVISDQEEVLKIKNKTLSELLQTEDAIAIRLEILKVNMDYLEVLGKLYRIGLTNMKEKHCGNTNPNEPKRIFDVRFDKLPAKCNTDELPHDCAEATACTGQSGIYRMIIPQMDKRQFLAFCDVRTDHGDWLIIQTRKDGSENFTRSWLDYKEGFGSVQGEYWLGLDNIYCLTNFNGPQELYILLEDFDGESRYAKYDNFQINNERDGYRLKTLGSYNGTAGDAMTSHILGMPFATYDRDNKDECAKDRLGGWWFSDCATGYLNGKYYYQGPYNGTNHGLHWYQWRGVNYSYRKSIMMIRRQKK